MLIKQTLFAQSLFLFAANITGLSAEDFASGNIPAPAGSKSLVHPSSLSTGKLAVGASLPTSVDLRGPSMPAPGNQGTTPSCSAWATTYSMKTYQEAGSLGGSAFSYPLNCLSPEWTYRNIPHGSNGGSYIADALEFMRTKGCDHRWNTNLVEVGGVLHYPQPPATIFANCLNFQCGTWVTMPLIALDLKSVLAYVSDQLPIKL